MQGLNKRLEAQGDRKFSRRTLAAIEVLLARNEPMTQEQLRAALEQRLGSAASAASATVAQRRLRARSSRNAMPSTGEPGVTVPDLGPSPDPNSNLNLTQP